MNIQVDTTIHGKKNRTIMAIFNDVAITILKGRLLQRKRIPFTNQKAVFQSMKDGLLKD